MNRMPASGTVDHGHAVLRYALTGVSFSFNSNKMNPAATAAGKTPSRCSSAKSHDSGLGSCLNPAYRHPRRPIWSHLHQHARNTKGRTPEGIRPFLSKILVGARGFEPPTPRSRTEEQSQVLLSKILNSSPSIRSA